MYVDCSNLIGGRFEAGQATFENRCPADESVLLGHAPSSGAAEIEAAVAAAKAAFPAWADTPAPQRGQLLFRLVRLVEQHTERLATALAMEEGKTIGEARGEIGKAVRYLEFSAGDARRMNGQCIESEMPGTMALTIWRPLGVVGLITPWNFPVAIPLWKMAPALVAGNTVVLKPAPETPATAHILAELITEAGFPNGVVNVVHGDAAPAIALIEHKDVTAISFTGSTEVGARVEARCGALHKRVQCELGGKNPILVFDDADLELAAAATALGAFGSTGQRCTATSRAIVMGSVADAFVERVSALAAGMRPGHPLDPGTSMGPSVSARQLDKVLSYMKIGVAEARLVTGGGRATEGDLARGYFPRPTLFDHVRPDARIASEEIFGPVLSVIRVDSVEQAIAAANAVPFGLTGSVFTQDLSRAFRVIRQLETGMMHINNPTIGGEAHLPFGGIKATGVGAKEMGPDAWRFYSEDKTVYVNYAAVRRTSNIY